MLILDCCLFVCELIFKTIVDYTGAFSCRTACTEHLHYTNPQAEADQYCYFEVH